MKLKRGVYFILALIFGATAFWLLPTGRYGVEAQVPTNLDWPNYGNDLGNNRFQNVNQINTKNVKNLQVAWVFHTGVLDQFATLQVSPVVVNGSMFITDGHDDVFALNAATGAQLWAYKPLDNGELPALETLPLCCGRNNKGVAVGNGNVYYGRFDDVAVALNAQTGAVVWKTKLADFHQGYAIVSAPQFVTSIQFPHGLVIISLAGGEYEVRGQVLALDSGTGAIVWKTFTTQGPDTWGGNAFLTGGATVWDVPSIDPALGLIYVNTGNAAPDVLGQNRPGNNNFTASIVAMDVNTGAIKWSFQEVHHDIWDYDAAQSSVLFNLVRNGVSIPAIGHCNKSGQYFILDRRDGTPLYAVTERPVPTDPGFQHASPTQPFSAVEPLTPLTFVRPNDTGFPAAPQFTPPQQTTFVMVPGNDGGCEWAPAAFSPRTNFVYYGTRYQPTTFHTVPNNTSTVPVAGTDVPEDQGSSFATPPTSGTHAFGIFGATDTTTGKVVWKLEVDQPAKSGIVVAGDVAFFGESNGKFHAVNAATGAVLFTFDAPAQVANAGGSNAGPIAYVINGQEFIANPFGGNLLDRLHFPPDPVGDAIVAFTLPQ